MLEEQEELEEEEEAEEVGQRKGGRAEEMLQ